MSTININNTDWNFLRNVPEIHLNQKFYDFFGWVHKFKNIFLIHLEKLSKTTKNISQNSHN